MATISWVVGVQKRKDRVGRRNCSREIRSRRSELERNNGHAVTYSNVKEGTSKRVGQGSHACLVLLDTLNKLWWNKICYILPISGSLVAVHWIDAVKLTPSLLFVLFFGGLSFKSQQYIAVETIHHSFGG